MAGYRGFPSSSAPSGSAGGDLSGSYPDPDVAAVAGVTPGDAGLDVLSASTADAALDVLGAGSTGKTVLEAADATTARSAIGASRQLVWTATKTSTYNAAVGEAVACNSSGGAFTVNLPASPSAGDVVRVADVNGGTTTGKEITVSGNGHNIDGSSMHIIGSGFGARDFSYIGSAWKVV